MTGVFTISPVEPAIIGDTLTLVDDAGGLLGTIEELGGEPVEQVDELAFASFAARVMRGNVRGQCVFSAAQSYKDAPTAAAALKTAYALMGMPGSLVLTFGATTLTMAGATVGPVRMVKFVGTRLVIRYSFGITSID